MVMQKQLTPLLFCFGFEMQSEPQRARGAFAGWEQRGALPVCSFLHCTLGSFQGPYKSHKDFTFGPSRTDHGSGL